MSDFRCTLNRKLNRAYSILEIKSVDADRRVITGVATTPTPDRMGDVIEPLGVTFTNPLPLLLHHDTRQPVGTVLFDAPTAKGITFTASLPLILEPGVVKDRVDEAWHSVKAGLIRGASIGFKPLGDAVEQLKNGGLRFLKTLVAELSLVTVPANAEATILSIKSFDLAATGLHTPGVTGPLPTVRAVKAAPAMTIQEQITQFENTRAAKAAARDGLMTKAAETGETLDQAQSEQYDALDLEIKSVDAHLVRLRALEQSNMQKAAPITAKTPEQAAEQRSGIIQVKSMLPKGTAFARYCMAIAVSKGDKWQALELSKQWKDSTPEVELYMKGAVAAGTTTDATWAAPLMPAAQAVMGEFLDLLRPATILGKLTKLTKVPFNVAVTSQTGAGTYGWVGESKVKPVSALAFAKVTLGFAKIAGIIVITDELAKFSSPSAEARVRDDMVKGTAGFMDAQFINPAVAEVVGVNPASITNGIVAIASGGVTAAFATADIKALVATFVAAGISLANATLIMSEANAFALSTAQNPLGQPMFPGLGVDGGKIFGIDVVTSQAAGSMVILVDQEGILYADDGATAIDVSREASLQMDSAPTDPVVGATVLVSLWQQNMVGLRAERFCTWKRARLASVAHTSGAAYV